MKGVKIPFVQEPHQVLKPVTTTTSESEKILDTEVQNLLQKGAIFQTTLSDEGFYSRLFLIPKKDGTMRPVFDLSLLNNFIENKHFQMENLSSIKTLLNPGDWMTKLDLRDAYLTVAIDPQSQKFLRFIWKDKIYQFQALPFGLNIAPLVFTQLLKPVAAYLRKRGVRLILYLDDMLIIGSSVQETRRFTQMAKNLLMSLGFTIHTEKSISVPTKVINFLGFTIDSNTMLISLPAEKTKKTVTLCRHMLTTKQVSIRTLAQLLGVLESHRAAVWRAPLHFRQLQSQLISGLLSSNHCYDTIIHLTRASKL